MQHKPMSFSLDEMVRLVAKGSIALPEFQREFVWDPNQVVDLLDSIANGWPIGSLLVLEGPQPFGIKDLEAGPHVEPALVKYYLLDGQQRVTSLFHALTDTGEYVYYIDFADDDMDEGPIIRWASRARGIPRSRRSTSQTIAALTEPLAFEEFSAQQTFASPSRIRQVRDARLGFIVGGDYQIPATVMFSEIELEALTRIFETLNRTGVRLDAFDLMVAVLYPQGFHLRDRWDQARDELPLMDLLGADGLEILKLIALWQRGQQRQGTPLPQSKRVLGIRQRDVLRTPAAFVQQQWDRAVGAYNQSLAFLHREGGVLDAAGVPSSAMTLTIAHMLDRGVAPERIRGWYWRAVADQRYLQGANTQVLADLDEYEASSTGVPGPDPTHRDVVRKQVSVSLMEPIRRNRILRMGLRGLLVLNGALDPVTGEPLRGPLTDISLRELAFGHVGYSAASPVIELLVVSRESERELRRRVRTQHPDGFLDPIALQSQAAPLPTSAVGDDWSATRATQFLSWMERAL